MSIVTFTDGRVYYAGIDVSGYTNQASLNLEASELDASSIRDGYDVTVLGRRRAALDVSGWWAGGDDAPDGLFAKLGAANQVATLAPDGTDGGIAYSVQGVVGKFSIGGGAGELLPYSFNAKGDRGIRAIRGTIMHDDSTARTSTSTGVIRQLGAVSSTQRVYAALHVLSVSGTLPTLDVTIESDSAVGFTTAATQLTFTQQTAAGGEWQSAAGAITDDWWRVKWTVGGTLPSFTFAVVVAIH